MSVPGTVDFSNILSVCRVGDALDRDLLKEMCGYFIDENRRRMTAAAAAVDSQDRNALQQLAHTIRGSAAILGASYLRDLAGIIECDALAGDLQQLRSVVGAMGDEFGQVLATLREAHPEVWTD
jgi:HPt (histidine-containing phosphotransfer) domain-containing protein